jgi:uncharacterized membrane protein YeiH
MLILPVVIEILALTFGALSGALHGVRRHAGVIGLFVLSLSTSVGGSLLRDVLIGQGPPAALRYPRYLWMVAGAALGTVLLASWLSRVGRILRVVDALLLGLWVVMGLEKALRVGLPVTSAVFLGVVTAAGGGLVRDVLSGDRPALTLRGELHVTAALAGALLYVLVVRLMRLPAPVGEIATIAGTAVLRVLAITHHWRAPGPLDLPHRWRSRRPAPPRGSEA